MRAASSRLGASQKRATRLSPRRLTWRTRHALTAMKYQVITDITNSTSATVVPTASSCWRKEARPYWVCKGLSFERELDRNDDRGGNGHRALARGHEAPLAHGLERRVVEARGAAALPERHAVG